MSQEKAIIEILSSEHVFPKYKGNHICKITLLKLKSRIKHYTTIVGDFNTPLSPLDRSARQKLNREIRELTDVITQMNLIDIYRPFQPNIKECNFFSAPHRIFSKIYHILGNKANPNRLKKRNNPRNSI